MSTVPQTLVLFSGGKDSFLTACRLVEGGRRVALLSFNNGSLAGESNLAHGAARLKNRYGDRITYIGVCSTVGTLRLLDKDWIYAPWEELGRTYPGLFNAQINCLHCQSAMWITAIAYAKAKRIDQIATGYKSCDLFCTGMSPWIDRMRIVAGKYGITVATPLWETPEWGTWQDVGRDREMEDHMFSSSVLEPWCTIGMPVDPPTEPLVQTMMRYFDDKISPLVEPQIQRLENIFRYRRLFESSLNAGSYQVPDGSRGLY